MRIFYFLWWIVANIFIFIYFYKYETIVRFDVYALDCNCWKRITVKWYKRQKMKKFVLKRYQILTNDVQMLILCLSYFITTVLLAPPDLKS